MTRYVFIILSFLLTYAGVEIFRRWTLKRGIFDIPNERSSHTAPTPRGGGLIIVIVSLISYTLYSMLYAGNISFGYLFGAILIAVVSWFDDLKSISSGVRFLIHAIGAAAAIISMGYLRTIYLPLAGEIEFGELGIVVTFLWICWMTNAYNFMDGIDGIAGAQGVTAGVGWFVVGILLNVPSTGFFGLILASACLGFLLHNWQPARIFMGDVGSAFLGYTFAVLPLMAINEANSDGIRGLFALIAILLVWLFVFDTIFTFFRRLLRGEKVWQAHRSHLYQRLVISGYNHASVTMLYGCFSIFVLLSGFYRLSAGTAFDWLPVLSILGVISILLLLARRKKIVDVT